MDLLRTLEARARDRLPAPVYDYVAGGAGDERSLTEAETAWDDWWLVPRQLTGVVTADLTTTLLGSRHAAPLVLAPTASQRMLHPDGELAVARAAAEAGLVACLSTRATTDLAEVAAAAPEGERWFQLYVAEDRDRVAQMLRRAAEHGYTQVVLTIDLPVGGRREREARHAAIPLPEGVSVVDHVDTLGPGLSVNPDVGGWAAVTWDDLGWVTEVCGLPVMVKGVLSAHDAEQAVAHGASAVVVSAHGARQLDGVVPTAVVLPEVVAAVAGRVPVLVDGGIRDGGDVARALALGASSVLIGRPYLWGLAAGGPDAAGGQAGVAEVLNAFTADLARTLGLLGAHDLAGLGPHHLRRSGPAR